MRSSKETKIKLELAGNRIAAVAAAAVAAAAVAAATARPQICPGCGDDPHSRWPKR